MSWDWDEPMINLNNELYYCCLNGNLEKAINMGKNDVDYNQGLLGACVGGHLEIAKLMLEKGGKKLNLGLYHACVGGNIDIIELLISKGANRFNRGLAGACNSFNKKIALLMISKGADIDKCNIRLDFDDVYYLIQIGIKDFPQRYSKLVNKCKKWKQKVYDVSNEFFIKDIANIIIEY